MDDLTDAAKAEIQAAIAIIREDKFEKFARGQFEKWQPKVTDPPKPTDPPTPPTPPPPKPEDPPKPDEPPAAKKGGIWWGEVEDG